MIFNCGRFQLDLSKPRVMGIVNVTPDSFSDGGKFNTTEKAIEHALQLVRNSFEASFVSTQQREKWLHELKQCFESFVEHDD